MAQNALISSLVISVGLFVAACTGAGATSDVGDAGEADVAADVLEPADSGDTDSGSGEGADASEPEDAREETDAGSEADACDGCA